MNKSLFILPKGQLIMYIENNYTTNCHFYKLINDKQKAKLIRKAQGKIFW